MQASPLLAGSNAKPKGNYFPIPLCFVLFFFGGEVPEKRHTHRASYLMSSAHIGLRHCAHTQAHRDKRRHKGTRQTNHRHTKHAETHTHTHTETHTHTHTRQRAKRRHAHTHAHMQTHVAAHRHASTQGRRRQARTCSEQMTSLERALIHCSLPQIRG